MRFNRILSIAAVLVTLPVLPAKAQGHLADLLAQPQTDLGRPADRERVVKRLDGLERTRHADARARAGRLGLPLRRELPGGRLQEIADFDFRGQPVYRVTCNANAAISTGASLIRVAPYSLTGSGVVVGVWDGGSVRPTHQEFGTRITVMDGASAVDHSTHVGGTIGASGIVASARGMAGSVLIDSYDWNYDTTEMTARAATAAGQAGKLYLSNHSYSYLAGWNYVGGTGSPARTWEWSGSGTSSTSVEDDFGRYYTYARDGDSLAFSAPYFLMFRAAGNERGDTPTAGSTVALSPGSTSVVAYDAAIHPAGDGVYRGGFDTIAFNGVGKNVITVGSVTDAVASGVRNPASATVSNFSSWGPTDDGRIKPDIVANGDSVYSTLATGDAAYGYYSGTSMACPNACGSAALLVQHYGNLFPGQAMRSSTLKGLLIHTADDRGNAGPDYKYGWGLINVKAAADLLTDHQAYPAKQRLMENQITTTVTTRTVSFIWDAVSPITATLCWTDPAGVSTTTSDSRTARLVNNLNLKIIAPGGAAYLPFVMPFVGTWTQASMDLPATTGTNVTDNVEQVRLASPPAAGVYQAVVSYSGTLANSAQNYSLLISGSSAEEPPPPVLALSGVSPASALSGGSATLTLTGSGLRATTAVTLVRAGQPDIIATGEQLAGENLICQVDLTGASAGLWDVVASNPSPYPGTSTLVGAFTVTGAVWGENFDGTVTGWSIAELTGTNTWTLSSTRYKSPSKSYFAAGPSTRSSTALVSPSIFVSSGATDLQFKFWHWFNLQSRKDGGRLEFQIDNGAWTDIVASGTGNTFASNGYGNTLNSNTNDYNGKSAWTGTSGGVFVETVVNLNTTANYAGKNLRFRWILATNSVTSSSGWNVDSISLVGGGNLTNQPPTIATAPTSGSTVTVTDGEGVVRQVVSGTTANLTVLGADDGGESALTYTWAGAAGPAPVSFSPNQSNGAKATTVSFDTAGDYDLSVSVADPQGLATTGTLNLRVGQIATGVEVTPGFVSLTVGGAQQFSALTVDQFGIPMASQPGTFAWSASGGGTVNSTGLYQTDLAGGPYAITATSGSLSGLASVTVNRLPASVELGNLQQIEDGAPKPVSVTTVPAGLAVSVTYNGSATVPVAAGSYAVVAMVSDPNYQGGAEGTLVIDPAAGWTAWQNENFTGPERDAGLADDLADPDGDGLVNLAEYALGTDPGEATAGMVPDVVDGSLVLIFTRPAGLPDVIYAAEHSDGLGVWDAVALEVLHTEGDTDTVKVSVPVATGDPARHFIRLKFTRE